MHTEAGVIARWLSWGILTFREPKNLLGLEWNDLEKILVSLLCHLVPSSTFQNSPNTTQRNSTLFFEWPLSSIVWFAFFGHATHHVGFGICPQTRDRTCAPCRGSLGVLTTGIPIFSVKAEHSPVVWLLRPLPYSEPVTCGTLHTRASLSWVSTVITWTCQAGDTHSAGPHPPAFLIQ